MSYLSIALESLKNLKTTSIISLAVSAGGMIMSYMPGLRVIGMALAAISGLINFLVLDEQEQELGDVILHGMDEAEIITVFSD